MRAASRMSCSSRRARFIAPRSSLPSSIRTVGRPSSIFSAAGQLPFTNESADVDHEERDNEDDSIGKRKVVAKKCLLGRLRDDEEQHEIEWRQLAE